MDLNKTWAGRIQRAKKVREDWAEEFKIDLGRSYFEGRQNPGYPADEWITVNKIYSHLQAQLPLLYSMDPYFYVKLKKSYVVPTDGTEQASKAAAEKVSEMERRGTIRQAMLNYLKGELKLKEKARMGIVDAHFEYGVLKVRRASTMQKHPHAGKPILNDEGKPMKDETGKTMVYPDELPVNERYELSRVHPCDFLFDEDAGPLEDSWKWVAQKITMSKRQALDDPRYKTSAVKSIQPKAKGEKKETGGIITTIFNKIVGDSDDEAYVDIWEIFDLEKREFLTFAEDAKDLLVEPQACPPGVEKHPFSILRFTLRDKSPYPIPPVFPALDPQKEYSLSRSRLLTHRKRFNRKYTVIRSMLDGDADAEASKLENGDDGTFVFTMAHGAIEPITDAPLDQQGLIELNMLNNDLTEIFGTPGSARGVADSDSATEASILDKRLEVREGDRMSMVVDWVKECASKLDQLVQYHIDRDEAVKITGPQGEFWQIVKQQDYEKIEGEFEYSVNIGASQPRLPDIERSQWIAFMSQVIIPFPHILTSPTIMKRMAEMFHIEDEAAIEEFRQLGLKIMSGQMPMPGGQGGGPSDNPVASILGAALGPQGGNANGGGAPTLQQ